MTAAATPAVMPGAKCGHTEGAGVLHRRCAKKADHRGNHTMLSAPPPDEQAASTFARITTLMHDLAEPEPGVVTGGFSPRSDVVPTPPVHDRSKTQDAAAALEVAAKVGRISTQGFVLTVAERRLAAQLHDLIVARVGSTLLAVGELASPAVRDTEHDTTERTTS